MADSEFSSSPATVAFLEDFVKVVQSPWTGPLRLQFDRSAAEIVDSKLMAYGDRQGIPLPQHSAPDSSLPELRLAACSSQTVRSRMRRAVAAAVSWLNPSCGPR